MIIKKVIYALCNFHKSKKLIASESLKILEKNREELPQMIKLLFNNLIFTLWYLLPVLNLSS